MVKDTVKYKGKKYRIRKSPRKNKQLMAVNIVNDEKVHLW